MSYCPAPINNYSYDNSYISASNIITKIDNITNTKFTKLYDNLNKINEDLKKILLDYDSEMNEHINIKIPNILEGGNDTIDDNSNNNIDKEIDNYSKTIDSLLNEYLEIKDLFIDKTDELKKIIKKNDEDVKKINIFMKFIEDINDNNIEGEIYEKQYEILINEIDKLSKDIYNNSKINIVKKEYIIIKAKFDKYVELIKKFNMFNMSHICPCCLTSVVNKVVTPCGHTFCDKCISEIKKKSNENDYNCIFCRSPIVSTFKLYFN
jgi:hypothetical protein